MKYFHTHSRSILSLVLCIGFFLSAYTTHAATVDSTYTVLAPLPCIESPASGNTPAVTCPNGNGSLATTVDVQEYIQYLFNLLIAVAAVMAVLMMVLGGFEYMTSDAYSQKSAGLEKFKHAIEGLILVLCSFLILQTINPQFVQVPIGLVAPLNITAPKNQIITSFFTQMDDLAAQYASNNQALTAQRVAAQAKVADLQGQIDDIQAQMMTWDCQDTAQPGEDSQCAALRVQQSQLQKQITSSTADMSSLQGSAVFQDILNNATSDSSKGGSTVAQIETYVKKTNTVYTQTLSQLTQLGASDKIATLNEAYNSAIGKLRVQEYVQDATDNYGSVIHVDALQKDLSNIQNIVGVSILSKVTDPNDHAALQAMITSATTQIQKEIDYANGKR